MTLTVLESASATSHALALRLAHVVHVKPVSTIGLASGRTPVEAYAELQRMCADGATDWNGVATFNLDEFVGVDGSHPGSFRQFMQRHLFRGLNLDVSRIHFLNGAAPDLNAECRRYEAAITSQGGIDLQLLGIGANGHIGFNEPADELISRTHRVTLTESTRRANAGLFADDPLRVPREALTMGVATILAARSIVLVATGGAKADAVRRALRGPVTTRVPASLLQLHPSVELFLDAAAAAMI